MENLDSRNGLNLNNLLRKSLNNKRNDCKANSNEDMITALAELLHLTAKSAEKQFPVKVVNSLMIVYKQWNQKG